MILLWWAFREARPLGFDCPTICDSSVDRYVEVVVVAIVDYFSWDSSVDWSFETTMDSFSRVFWVRDIHIIMTLSQALWFS